MKPTILQVLLLLAWCSQAMASAPECREHAVPAGPVAIHAKDCGHVQDTAFILVPGWGADHSIWAPIIDELASGHRVIAIDPRSQGLSSVATEGNSPEGRAGDIDAVIRHLNLRRVVAVGWSIGAQDVASLAHLHDAQYLLGIVLVDGALSKGLMRALSEDPEDTLKQLGRANMYRKDPQGYLEGMMRSIFLSPVPPERIADLVHRAMRSPPDIMLASLFASLYGEDRTGYLDSFRKPVLTIASDTSACPQQPAIAVTRARTRIDRTVCEAGHAVIVEQAAAVSRLLNDFLASTIAQEPYAMIGLPSDPGQRVTSTNTGLE